MKIKVINNPKSYYESTCDYCVPRYMRKPIINIESPTFTLVDCDGIYCSHHAQELIRELQYKIICIQKAVNQSK